MNKALAIGTLSAFMTKMVRLGVKQALKQKKKLKPIWSCTKTKSTNEKKSHIKSS